MISGGDRHACEPAARLNLTNSKSFGEFVSEIRAGHSRVLFMPHYREPMALRILETAWEILRPYPEYLGRERWTDRVFYRCADAVAQPLSTVWKDRVPWIVRPVTGMLQLCAMPGVRPALRLLLSSRAELQPWKAAALRFAASLQCLSGDSIAILLAVGIVLGTFPVYGCSTVLCLLAALVFRLNAPGSHLVNQVSSPLQLMLLIPFARLGERILGSHGTAPDGILSRFSEFTLQAVAGWFSGLAVHWGSCCMSFYPTPFADAGRNASINSESPA